MISYLTKLLNSLGSGEESEDDAALKPAKKKQISLQDFFAKNKEKDNEQKPPTPSKIAAMKPKPKAAPVKKAPAKIVESDDDELNDFKPPSKSKATKKAPAPVKKSKKDASDDDGDDSAMEVDAAPPKRNGAPRRTARSAPKKYIELSSEEDDVEEDETFEVSD